MPSGLLVGSMKWEKEALPRMRKALTPPQISRAMDQPTRFAAMYVAKNKLMKPQNADWSLSGQALSIRSGNLRRSLLPSVRVKDYIASFGTQLAYGAVHERKRKWLRGGTEDFIDSGKYASEFFKALKREAGV